MANDQNESERRHLELLAATIAAATDSSSWAVAAMAHLEMESIDDAMLNKYIAVVSVDRARAIQEEVRRDA